MYARGLAPQGADTDNNQAPAAMRTMNAHLKGHIFLINGHTDAKGGDQYKQTVSAYRVEAVKRILINKFKLPADALLAVGYGKTQLKNTADPFAGENRRVQIVDTEQQVAGREIR
jgi:outer membrane protein OmpA-like peptidoglycan-associated protein